TSASRYTFIIGFPPSPSGPPQPAKRRDVKLELPLFGDGEAVPRVRGDVPPQPVLEPVPGQGRFPLPTPPGLVHEPAFPRPLPAGRVVATQVGERERGPALDGLRAARHEGRCATPAGFPGGLPVPVVDDFKTPHRCLLSVPARLSPRPFPVRLTASPEGNGRGATRSPRTPR